MTYGLCNTYQHVYGGGRAHLVAEIIGESTVDRSPGTPGGQSHPLVAKVIDGRWATKGLSRPEESALDHPERRPRDIDRYDERWKPFNLKSDGRDLDIDPHHTVLVGTVE